jgi:hypothetical protein
MRSDVPKAVNVELQIIILWVMIPCSLVDMYERFEGTCRFLLQEKRSINIYNSVMLLSFALNTEVAGWYRFTGLHGVTFQKA